MKFKIDKHALIISTIFILIIILPIIYGLATYNWDLVKLLTSGIKIPKIDFNASYKGFKISDNNIIISLIIENKGDIPIEITNLEGDIYVKNIKLGRLNLLSPTFIDIGGKSELKVIVKPDIEGFVEVIGEILKGVKVLKAEVKGMLTAKSFGVTAKIPITYTINLPINQLIPITYKFKEVKISKNILYTIIEVKCNMPLKVKDMKLTASINKVQIGICKLQKPITMKPAETKEIELILKLEEKGLELLIQKIIQQGKTIIDLQGQITINVMGKDINIPIKIPYTLTLSQLYKEIDITRYISIEFKDVTVKEDKIYIDLLITSKIKVLVEKLATDVFHDNLIIGSLRLDKPILLEPNKPKTIKTILTIHPKTLPILISKAAKNIDIELVLKGNSTIRFMNIAINIPIKTKIKIPHHLLKPENYFKIILKDLTVEKGVIKGILELKSNITLKLLKITGSIKVDETTIAQLEYLKPKIIKEKTSTTIAINIKPTLEGLLKLIEKAIKLKNIPLNINLTASLNIAGINITIPFTSTYNISREFFKIENYINITYDYKIINENIIVYTNISSKIPLEITNINITITYHNIIIGTSQYSEVIEIPEDMFKEVKLKINITQNGIRLLIKKALKGENIKAILNINTQILIAKTKLSYRKSWNIIIDTSSFNPRRYIIITLKSIGRVDNKTIAKIIIVNNMSRNIVLQLVNLTIQYNNTIIGYIILNKTITIPPQTIITIEPQVLLNHTILQQLLMQNKTIIKAITIGNITLTVEEVKITIPLAQEIEINIEELLELKPRR